MQIGTWNVRSITGKEKELVDEFERSKIDILALTETKKKGRGIEKVDNNHILLYSGVPQSTRAQAGVALLVHKNLENRLHNWKFVSERILTVSLNFSENEKINFIIVYGKSEDARKEEKDAFYEEVQRTLDDSEGETVMLGDFNARVGNDPDVCGGAIGRYGEEVMNDNGERLVDLCVANNLVIANTMFPHKRIHQFTREEPARNEKSIIDYFLVKKEELKTVIDCRVHRGYEIGSDHYLVKMRKAVRSCGKNPKQPSKDRKINAYKLRQKEVQLTFKAEIEEKAAILLPTLEEESLDNKWVAFKDILLEAATSACGTSKVGNYIKKTSWWSDEIKREIKIKKQLWKNYLATKLANDYDSYKSQRKKVKDIVKLAKEAAWEEFGIKMEENHRDNQKLFYRAIKNMRKEKTCPLKHIKDKQGNIIKEDGKIMERWKEHFQELLNSEQDNMGPAEERHIEAGVEEVEVPEEITLQELQNALRMLKCGKAAGHDKISPEMLKYMGPVSERILLNIINEAWKTKSIPQDWEVAVIIPIFKKGDNRECNNHRGISLLSVAGKIFSRILELKLRHEVEHQLEEFQSGFRPKRSTQDLIFSMRMLSEKMPEKDKEFHAGYIDLSQAFDKVPRHEIWKSLKNLNVREHLIQAIKSLYNNCRNYVRTANRSSAEFETKQGVRQGDNLSPLLFIVYLDQIMKEVNSRAMKLIVGNYLLRPVKLCSLAFADDIVVLAPNERNLQHNMSIWDEELRKKGMKININKTQTMIVSRHGNRHNISIGNTSLEQVHKFKYLGSTISEDGKIDIEINERIGAASRLFHSIRNKFLGKREITKKTKLAVYKSTFVPTLTYGCESWALTKKHKSKLQSMEMRFLRKIENKTRRDRVRNVAIRSSLNIKPISQVIQEQQLRWFGHVQRMPPTRLPKILKDVRVEGRCRRGRPRRKWEEEVEDALRERGSSIREALPLTADRLRWRRIVTSTPTGRRGQD